MKALLVFATATLVLALIASASSQACLGDLVEVTEYVWVPGQPVSFCIAPDRDVRVFLAGGVAMTAELRCYVENWNQPAAETSCIEWAVTGVEFCGPDWLQVPRDGEGWIAPLPTMRGGGHRGPDQAGMVSLRIHECPSQYLDLGTEVFFNSPDINGDLQVNLGDVTLFAHDYLADYDYRSDFNWDGQVNLSDLAVMAQENGASCQ